MLFCREFLPVFIQNRCSLEDLRKAMDDRVGCGERPRERERKREWEKELPVISASSSW